MEDFEFVDLCYRETPEGPEEDEQVTLIRRREVLR
jgi:hypothetical protein